MCVYEVYVCLIFQVEEERRDQDSPDTAQDRLSLLQGIPQMVSEHYTAALKMIAIIHQSYREWCQVTVHYWLR